MVVPPIIPGGVLAIIDAFLQQWPTIYADIQADIEETSVEAARANDELQAYLHSLIYANMSSNEDQSLQIDNLFGLVVRLPADIYERIWPDVTSAINSRANDERQLTQQELMDLAIKQAQLEDLLGLTKQDIILGYQNSDRFLQEQLIGQQLDVDQVKQDIEEIKAEQERELGFWDKVGLLVSHPMEFLAKFLLEWLIGNLDGIFDTIETALWGES